MQDVEVVLARHDERITGLEEWREDHETQQNRSLDKIFTKLEQMGNRPTWAVSVIISVLSSLVVGLAVYVLTKGR